MFVKPAAPAPKRRGRPPKRGVAKPAECAAEGDRAEAGSESEPPQTAPAPDLDSSVTGRPAAGLDESVLRRSTRKRRPPATFAELVYSSAKKPAPGRARSRQPEDLNASIVLREAAARPAPAPPRSPVQILQDVSITGPKATLKRPAAAGSGVLDTSVVTRGAKRRGGGRAAPAAELDISVASGRDPASSPDLDTTAVRQSGRSRRGWRAPDLESSIVTRGARKREALRRTPPLEQRGVLSPPGPVFPAAQERPGPAAETPTSRRTAAPATVPDTAPATASAAAAAAAAAPASVTNSTHVVPTRGGGGRGGRGRGKGGQAGQVRQQAANTEPEPEPEPESEPEPQPEPESEPEPPVASAPVAPPAPPAPPPAPAPAPATAAPTSAPPAPVPAPWSFPFPAPFGMPPGGAAVGLPQPPPVQQPPAMPVVRHTDGSEQWLAEDESAESATSCRLFASPMASAGFVRVPPGGRKADALVHRQAVYGVVLSGEGELVTSSQDGEISGSQPIRGQDVFNIGPGTVYRIENTGGMEMLLWVTLVQLTPSATLLPVFFPPPAVACPLPTSAPGAAPLQ